jgi:hypothetical protein
MPWSYKTGRRSGKPFGQTIQNLSREARNYPDWALGWREESFP